MARARTISGAHLILYLNGRPYSLATGFSFQVITSRKAIYGVDSGEPYEIAPTTSKVTGQINLIRTIGDGGLEGSGIAAPLENVPREKYVTITLIERSSDTVVFQADQAAVVGQSWNVEAKSLMRGSMQFEAIDWSNEATAHE